MNRINNREINRFLKDEYNKTIHPNRQRWNKTFIDTQYGEALLAAGFMPIMKRSEYADVVGVSVKRICKLIRDKRLPIVAYKFWRERKVNYIDVQAMVGNNDDCALRLLSLAFKTIKDESRVEIPRTNNGVIEGQRSSPKNAKPKKKKVDYSAIHKALEERTNGKKIIYWQENNQFR